MDIRLKSKNDPKSVVTGPINVIQFPHAGNRYSDEYISDRVLIVGESYIEKNKNR